jgi:hypothetical protein
MTRNLAVSNRLYLSGRTTAMTLPRWKGAINGSYTVPYAHAMYNLERERRDAEM